MEMDSDTMRLTIVYDNEVYKKDIGLKSDWGFSCLLETMHDNILFDTGAKDKILINNMSKLDICPSDINKVVISHEHWDHSGGLKSFMSIVGDLEIYRLEKNDIGEGIRTKIIEESQMISKDVYTTGRLAGSPIDEQSLVLKGQKGWYVLAGCSHSGVREILQVSKNLGNVLGIIGGFHGFNDFSVLDDLDFICPCHCTKLKKKLRELYPTKFIEGGVGKVIDI